VSFAPFLTDAQRRSKIKSINVLHELYAARDRESGWELEDWLRAEIEALSA